MKIVEAIEDADFLRISAVPADSDMINTTDDVAAMQDTQQMNDGTPMDPLFVFGAKLLMFGVQAHFWHLNCSKNAEHLALKDLYEACDDVGDRILEAAIGIAMKPAISQNLPMSNLYDSQTSVEEIANISNEAARLIGVSGDAGMDNILGEFCETCNSVIYKLKRLQ